MTLCQVLSICVNLCQVVLRSQKNTKGLKDSTGSLRGPTVANFGKRDLDSAILRHKETKLFIGCHRETLGAIFSYWYPWGALWRHILPWRAIEIQTRVS